MSRRQTPERTPDGFSLIPFCLGCGVPAPDVGSGTALCKSCMNSAIEIGIWNVVDDPTVPKGHWRCLDCKRVQPIEPNFTYGAWGFTGGCGGCTNWGWA